MSSSARHPLGTLPLLQDVPTAVVDRLAALMTAVRVPAGEVVISEGALNRQFVLVEHGTLHVTRDGEQIAEIGPGEFVGELSLLGDRRATATVTAVADVRAYVSSSAEFGGLLHSVLGSHIAAAAAARRAA